MTNKKGDRKTRCLDYIGRPKIEHYQLNPSGYIRAVFQWNIKNWFRTDGPKELRGLFR